MAKGEGKVVAQNKKAHHDYTIVDTLEAGMVLTGTEIKSVRAARINLKDGFAQVKNGEVWLSNVHIAPYEEGNIWNQEPERRVNFCSIKTNSKIGTRDQRNRNDPSSPQSLYQRWLRQASFRTC